jgi:hypothetical protein
MFGWHHARRAGEVECIVDRWAAFDGEARYATKFRLDLRGLSQRGGGMTDYELVAALCLRIGMIMEDACADAVTVTPDDRDNLVIVVRTLTGASEQIDALAKVASALLDDSFSAPRVS